jgi:hypothetical protein
LLAVLLVKFFPGFESFFLKINERATLLEMEKKKKIKKEEGDRWERKRQGRGKEKHKRTKKKHTWLNLHP